MTIIHMRNVPGYGELRALDLALPYTKKIFINTPPVFRLMGF